mgnify:CR=1 FL=1
MLFKQLHSFLCPGSFFASTSWPQIASTHFLPMQAAGDFGTETDGSPSGEYCVYCYKGGTFTAACTMEEMIRHCAQFHEQFRDENGKSYTFEESVTLMREYFPTLKRWKKD